MDEFKCPPEDYSMLERMRFNLASAEVHYDHAEEQRKYFLKAGNFEAAKVMSNSTNGLIKTIRGLEKEIKHLESVCFVGSMP